MPSTGCNSSGTASSALLAGFSFFAHEQAKHLSLFEGLSMNMMNRLFWARIYMVSVSGLTISSTGRLQTQLSYLPGHDLGYLPSTISTTNCPE